MVKNARFIRKEPSSKVHENFQVEQKILEN